MLKPQQLIGPLYTQTQYKDIKDPCIVFDGTTWHIYGSGGDVRSEKWQILHAIAPNIEGPWKEMEVAALEGVRGDHVAAPSVWFDQERSLFHMMVQTEFTSIGGTVEYLVSNDGHHFKKENTALYSLPRTTEAGIYDPHQAIIEGQKYLVYAGTPAIEGSKNQYIIQPDIYLAKSESNEWNGPWKQMGKILDHDHIQWHHNSRYHDEYEWGIEGPQLVPLPNGRILLNATCFLCEGKFGTRQRVFFAIADHITGPYHSIGPVLNTSGEEWQSGENGHATAIIHEQKLHLFYQARSQAYPDASDNNWRYGIAVFALGDIEAAFQEQVKIV